MFEDNNIRSLDKVTLRIGVTFCVKLTYALVKIKEGRTSKLESFIA